MGDGRLSGEILRPAKPAHLLLNMFHSRHDELSRRLLMTEPSAYGTTSRNALKNDTAA
jgi:hypothetical protein